MQAAKFRAPQVKANPLIVRAGNVVGAAKAMRRISQLKSCAISK